jgi:hypothetical protein
LARGDQRTALERRTQAEQGLGAEEAADAEEGEAGEDGEWAEAQMDGAAEEWLLDDEPLAVSADVLALAARFGSPAARSPSCVPATPPQVRGRVELVVTPHCTTLMSQHQLHRTVSDNIT